MVPMSYYLILAAVLFVMGVIGVVIRRNAIVIFMCIELMLNSVNLTFVTHWNNSDGGEELAGAVHGEARFAMRRGDLDGLRRNLKEVTKVANHTKGSRIRSRGRIAVNGQIREGVLCLKGFSLSRVPSICIFGMICSAFHPGWGPWVGVGETEG